MKRLILSALLFMGFAASANTVSNEYLIKMNPESKAGLGSTLTLKKILPAGSEVENLGINGWHRVVLPKNQAQTFSVQSLMANKAVASVQGNYKLGLLHDFRIKDEALRNKVIAAYNARTQKDDNPFPFPFPDEGDGGEFPFPFPDEGDGGEFPFPFPDEGDGKGGGSSPVPPPGGGGGNAGGSGRDNPPFPNTGSGGNGSDPMFSKQWGMSQIGVRTAWQKTRGSQEIVVAVLDTGVDYTHEDLVDNMWRNPGESGLDAQGRDKATNGVDDDGNGFIDDLMGWDFAANDNKPYDLALSFMEIITQGGNPGHGTHCAGNVAARGDNGKGIAGVAPNVKIMALRFLSEKGGGTTADAIKSIKYAVDNGAQILSNSWGSSGEDPNDAAGNAALRDAVRYAESRGALFVAAAGNGDQQGKGYDNDSSRVPAYPASYDMDIIVSVAAIDEQGKLGSFSNWGKRTVDMGAPGVKVFSTVPGNKYQDQIGNFLGQVITWDGTSMATPHVSGAAALYWSLHPEKSWREVKEALMNSVKRTSVLQNKVVSGGQLDVQALMGM